MWPIQNRIANILRSAPKIVGIFKGSKKSTSACEFLQSCVDELLGILGSGINFRGEKKYLHLRCFIADAPARRFVLGHTGHNS